MRIISGQNRGKKLIQIQGRDIRPTSDRVREALFNIIGPAIRGQRMLDFFAGTGAFGLEALSRGAESAVFVDAAPASCEVIQKNIALCNMASSATLVCHDLVKSPLPDLAETFDLIFMDPPYNKGYGEKVLGKEGFIKLLAPDGLIIVEQSFKERLANPLNSLDIYRQKKYSKTFVSFLRETA
ncbi:MAG: 16S rRNA (guanine(966)-N(2))-methyltransferase RsmD [Desulfobacter sp.]|nr:16S rRNA (guanine(966)-N(2))-methyltransferase RsmD [Desulfobacter sp.]WDP85108.1 MAG: 16S rRNA (guanine(966)-N(2))-methyltransferase RsmD [Desulfobacter sp.]